MNNRLAFQGQAGNIQAEQIDGYHHVVLVNGHVISVDNAGFFETIVAFSADELIDYDFGSEEGRYKFEWDLSVRATGSAQIAHRSVAKIGCLQDGRTFFLLRGNVFALPHEPVGDCLQRVL